MTIVSDTGPLNYLVLIDAADILPQLYDQVLIPPAVQRELNHAKTPAAVRAWISNPPAWLEVQSLTRADVTRLIVGMPSRFGPGEQEAILLAEKLDLDLLTDDALAKEIALARGIAAAGTLGLLRDAAALGLLQLAPAIEKARAAGLYATDQLVERVLQSLSGL